MNHVLLRPYEYIKLVLLKPYELLHNSTFASFLIKKIRYVAN